MSVLVKNSGPVAEHIDVIGKDKTIDQITVMPGGQVELAPDQSVVPKGVARPHIHVSGKPDRF